MEGKVMSETRVPKLGFEGVDRLLNAREVAQLLNVSISAVRLWRFRGILPVVQVGRCVRFKLSEIQKLVSKGLTTKR
jgi:excisionase family DNA binding protein